jgi:CO/xanthine dehydrogenase FAD-binding subunit
MEFPNKQADIFVSLNFALFRWSKTMSELKYLVPLSLREALTLIHGYQGQARVMAGGTDLLARMKKGLEIPEVIINIEGLRELNYIDYDSQDGLRIGAVTPLSAIEKSAVVQSKFPVLAQAAGLMASPTVRSRATIGGNLGNAAPSADIVPALIVLGAVIKIMDMEGEKVVPVEELFAGPGRTVLQPGQIIAEVRVPEMPQYSAGVYLKQKRREGADLAVVGTAAMVTLTRDTCTSESPVSNNLLAKIHHLTKLIEPELFHLNGAETNAHARLLDGESRLDITIVDLKIALGAVAPTPIRASKAEAVLRGKKVTPALLAEAGRVASAESQPIDDVRSSVAYRRRLVEVLVPRAILQAMESINLEVKH